jgi:hypothetical protein
VHPNQKTRDDRVYLHQLRELMREYLCLFAQVRALAAAQSA